MTNLILAALMQVSAMGADQVDFNQAYQRSLQTKQPLVVLIGAVWCPACQKMSNSIIPQVAEADGLKKVVFIYLDYDQHRQLVSRLSRTKSIPQLIRFDHTASGWKSKRLVGAKSPREVYDFINAGLIDNNLSKASTTSRLQKQAILPAGKRSSTSFIPEAKTEIAAQHINKTGREKN